MKNIQLEIVEAKREHTKVLRHLFELYCHDFSSMTQADVRDDTGMWTDDQFLSGYWPEPDFHPFLLKVNGRWAGFAWVMEGSYVRTVTAKADHYLMEEFFILRKYRRQGIGEWFATQLFDRFPGVWEVGEIHENVEAQAFWRKVIGRYTGGRFEEMIVNNDRWSGPVQVLDSATSHESRVTSHHQS
jgi:predicted acetyltransferase